MCILVSSPELASHLALSAVTARTVAGALDLMLATPRAGVDHPALVGIRGGAAYIACIITACYSVLAVGPVSSLIF
ncbi:hypothetical protein BDW71DRAFT_186295 [Aspergillus fruticulosus]